MAPTLRELVKADGSRIAVLDVIVQVKKTQLADWKTVERFHRVGAESHFRASSPCMLRIKYIERQYATSQEEARRGAQCRTP